MISTKYNIITQTYYTKYTLKSEDYKYIILSFYNLSTEYLDNDIGYIMPMNAINITQIIFRRRRVIVKCRRK